MSTVSKYLIDTNVFLRLLAREDEQSFQESMQLLQACKSGKLKAVTHDLVVTELVWTLQSGYKQSKSATIQMVTALLNLRGLEVVSSFDRYLAFHYYQHHAVKYVDACLASIPQVHKREWAVVSYDSDFKKLPILWLRPAEVAC